MTRTNHHLLGLVLSGAILGAPSQVWAQDATITYTAISTTHAYADGEDVDDLLALFSASPEYCTESITTAMSTNAAGVCGIPGRTPNLGYHTEISFGVCGPATYQFRVGADWGRGGAIYLDDALVGSSTDDLWWGGYWSATSEVVYSTAMELGTGVHLFDAFGFEGCCDGVTSMQFRVNGGAWQDATVAALSLVDLDGDDVGDACDVCLDDPVNDVDNDGLCANVDNCPTKANTDQLDTDADGKGDACDTDDDGDGVLDADDNCPLVPNLDQLDWDMDFVGNACDTDDDGDGVLDGFDLCLQTEYGAPVGTDGCSVDDLCPCENSWKNHGSYVSCVAHASEDLLEEGVIDEAMKDAIVSEAAGSSCGAKR